MDEAAFRTAAIQEFGSSSAKSLCATKRAVTRKHYQESIEAHAELGALIGMPTRVIDMRGKCLNPNVKACLVQKNTIETHEPTIKAQHAVVCKATAILKCIPRATLDDMANGRAYSSAVAKACATHSTASKGIASKRPRSPNASTVAMNDDDDEDVSDDDDVSEEALKKEYGVPRPPANPSHAEFDARVPAFMTEWSFMERLIAFEGTHWAAAPTCAECGRIPPRGFYRICVHNANAGTCEGRLCRTCAKGKLVTLTAPSKEARVCGRMFCGATLVCPFGCGGSLLKDSDDLDLSQHPHVGNTLCLNTILNNVKCPKTCKHTANGVCNFEGTVEELYLHVLIEHSDEADDA